jgi:opacity protein-like surface antigen
MNKLKLLLPCITAASMLVAVHAGASSKKNFYVTVPFGYDFLTNKKNNVGASPSATLKNTPFVGLGAGYDFGGIRAELSFNYRNKMNAVIDSVRTGTAAYGKYSEMKIKAYSLMLDLYKDFDIGSDFTPYVTAGLGCTRFKTGDYTFTRYGSRTNLPIRGSSTTESGKSSNSFAWRVGFGMNYKLTDAMDFGLGYAYNYLGKITRIDPYGIQKGDGSSNKLKFASNEIVANIKFKF